MGLSHAVNRNFTVVHIEKTIALVVEDEPLVRYALSAALQDAGCKVIEARNGTAALAVLQGGHGIDVLVTDVNLGDSIDGWTVAEASRAKNSNVAVIYVSGNAIEPARSVSASRFIAKPYAAKDILSAVMELIK